MGKWLSGAPRRGKYHLVAKEAGVEDGEVTKDKKVLRLMQILHGPSPGAKVGPHGFTDEEVLELRCQGVRPWDEDALVSFLTLLIHYPCFIYQCFRMLFLLSRGVDCGRFCFGVD